MSKRRKSKKNEKVNVSKVVSLILLIIIIGGLFWIISSSKKENKAPKTPETLTQVKETVTEAPETEPEIEKADNKKEKEILKDLKPKKTDNKQITKKTISREQIKENDSKVLDKQAEKFTKTKEQNFAIADKLIKDKFGSSAYLEDDLSDTVFIGRNGVDYYKVDTTTKKIEPYDIDQ